MDVVCPFDVAGNMANENQSCHGAVDQGHASIAIVSQGFVGLRFLLLSSFLPKHIKTHFLYIYLRFLNVFSMSACSGESCIAKCGQCYHGCMMHVCMLQSIIQSFWIEHKTASNCFYLYLIQIQVCTLGINFSVSNTVLINTV